MRTEVPAAFVEVACVWALLVLGGWLSPLVGPSWSTLLAFALATVLVLWARESRPEGRTGLQWTRALGLLAAALAGCAAYPACTFVIAQVGSAFGLPPAAPTLPLGGDPAMWVSLLVLGPIFEELLYRERLIGALRSRVGNATAIVVSSALFALPHFTAWSLLGTFLVGLGLGALYVRSRSVDVCIAVHVGLNSAVVLWGIPGRGMPFDPLLGALLAFALFTVALRTTPARRARNTEPRGARSARLGVPARDT